MFRQKQIYLAVLALCTGGFAAGVAAQQQTSGGNDQPSPPADQAQQLRRVEVTGSRIKRIDTETPSPVSVITREQIERSGALSVAEVLKRAAGSQRRHVRRERGRELHAGCRERVIARPRRRRRRWS